MKYLLIIVLNGSSSFAVTSLDYEFKSRESCVKFAENLKSRNLGRSSQMYCIPVEEEA